MTNQYDFPIKMRGFTEQVNNITYIEHNILLKIRAAANELRIVSVTVVILVAALLSGRSSKTWSYDFTDPEAGF